jgi:WD40 repeat protein
MTRRVADAYQVLYLDPLQAVDKAYQATEIKKTPQGEAALRVAQKVANDRREIRNEESQITGTAGGFSFVADRWKEGAVFTKLSRDGHYALVASERGKGSPNPPGTAYLINLDNLRTQELPPEKNAVGRRLEYMGFSNSGEQIFVVRQFYLDVYGIEGDHTQSVNLDYHAQPINLIAGMFGSYVLVGDTTGHLFLADTVSSKRPQLTSGHGAPLFIETNEKGTRAIVVFESGKADLVVLDNINTPIQREVANEAVIFATFSQSKGSERFLTATKSGEIDLWNFDGGTVKRLSHFNHGKTPVRLAGFSEDELRVISLGDDGTLRFWDSTTGGLIASIPSLGEDPKVRKLTGS